MNPLISIIVPIYNVERYIHRCIDSILAQTLSNIEIILVDDGSTDRCGKIADGYLSKDPRVLVLHKENGGQCSARNAGLDIARGEYIGFVDSDDWVDSEMFEGLYQAAKQSNADITICGREVYSEEGKLEVTVKPLETIINLDQMGVDEYFLDYFFYPHTPVVYNKLYKSDIIRLHNLRFEPIREVGSEDTLFNFSALCHAKRIASISKLFYKGTARNGSTARTYKNGEMLRTANLLKKCYEYSEQVGNVAVANRILPYMLLYFQQRNMNLIYSVYNKNSAAVIADELKQASLVPAFKYNANQLIFRHRCSKDMLRKGFRFSGRMVQRIFMIMYVFNMHNLASRFITAIFDKGSKERTG